jgi:hypothetical protein
MVRRVKAYLKTMKVITNEEELHKMSQECEPPLGGIPPPPPPITMVGIWLVFYFRNLFCIRGAV